MHKVIHYFLVFLFCLFLVLLQNWLFCFYGLIILHIFLRSFCLLHPLSFPPALNIQVSLSLTPHQVQYNPQYVHRCRAIYWSMCSLTKAASLMTSFSLFIYELWQQHYCPCKTHTLSSQIRSQPGGVRKSHFWEVVTEGSS